MSKISPHHLTGRVEFRFNLGQGQPRDRQHEIDSSSTSDSIQQNNIPHSKAGRKRPRDDSQDLSNTNCFQDEAEFYFIQDGDMCQNQSFLIVAASPEMYLVTTACSSNYKVEIHDFQLSTCNTVKTIHVYKDGIRCLIDEKVDSMEVDKKVRYLSLADVNKIEDSSDKNELKLLKRKMNIESMIDAISPIITVVKTDPFAIIEIYDDDGRSAVVILKGKHALQLHACIEPGNKILLKDVKRQKWHVPKSLEKEGIPKRLRSRSPEYVFVVSEVNQMSLEETAYPSKGTLPQCLPSTIQTSIQGEVISVKYTSFIQSGCEVRQLHYIFMKPCNFSNNDKVSGLMKLYMTYYPTSPSLFIGLKKGSIVRAINVHRCESYTLQTFKTSIGEEYSCFGACLRSTVSMTFMPECDKHEASHTSLSQIQFSVFAFKTIRRTYYEMEWISLFRMQFSKSKLILDHADKLFTSIQTRCNGDLLNRKKGRDPYFEFFDHGCECLDDEDKEDTREPSFCPVKMPQSDFPFFLSIDQIRRIGIMRIKEAMPVLHKTFSNKSMLDRKLGVGCTSSIHIRSDELSQQLGYCTGNICIAGAIHSIKSSEVRAINNDNYILQCCKCSFQAETSYQASRKEVKHIGDIINLNVHKVIVSMIYLGDYGPPATGNDGDVVVSDLKSSHSSSNGISFVVQQKNLIFLASLQLQYRDVEPIHLNTNTKSMDLKKTQSMERTKFARLVRQRWRPTRRKQVYNGYEVGLGNLVPFVDKKLKHDPYHHTIKLSIKLQSSAIDLPFLPPQVIAMADAWLGLVESSLSALLTGCWDELNGNTENVLYAIYLHFNPSDIVGKVIDLAQVNVKVIEYENTSENMKLFSALTITENRPSFLGGKPMVPGTVSDRVKRKHLVSKKIKTVFGEALIPPLLIGSNCSALSLSKLNFISSVGKFVPCYNSIKIRNAQVIKIRFCRAKAECNHCFSPLIRKKTEQHSRFWSNPLSFENLTTKSKAKVGTKSPRRLVCPNKCDERHAYIKWELSGILHDNTGTAKIFSERDTTLLILGEGLDVQCVESGAWMSPYGITYKAGIQMISKNAADSQEKMPVDSMAYLELYRHCTSCGTFQRPLDFICKIKSNPVNEPNSQDSEEIPIVSSLGKEGTVMRSSDLSFTSKSMNLVALDACRTFNEPHISGWSILNNL